MKKRGSMVLGTGAHVRRRNYFPLIITAIFVFGFVASLISTLTTSAAANIFKIQNVEQTGISASAEGTITGFDEQTITSGVVFHRLNDYVEYTITLKNTDTSAHIIETITDDNSNPYIIYDYLNHQNEQINAGSDLVFVVTVRYVNQADMNDRVSVNNVKFNIKFLDIEEDDEVIVVPDTGANTSASGGVSFSTISLIISALGLILICVLVMKKQKKASRVIVALIICISAITFAATVKAEEASVNGFTFTTGFAFKDRLIVTYKDANNSEHQEVINYGSLLNLENPEKNGYRFAGWKYADGSVFIASDPITDDISIVPVFTLDTYNISYDLAGGTTSEPNTTTYTVNDIVTLNEPTKAYYNFAGWTGTDLTEPTKNVVIPAGSTGDRSYTATYTPIDYSITYSNITTEELAPLNVPSTYNIETASFIIGKPATRVDGDGDPTYTFVGWKEGSTISETITLPDVNSMGSKTYEAQWAPVDAATYTISYELNGGTTATPNRTTFTKNDETFSIINPTKTGHTFKGWSGTDLTGDTNTNVQVVKGTRKSLSFEAHYTANTYKVIFDANNGSGSMADQTLTYDTATNLTTNTYTRFGYSFNGWNTEAGGTGTSYTDGASVINLRTEGEITLYAQWTANSYLVAFDCNHVGCEGTIGNLPMVYDVEKALPLNAFSVPGYTFAGWNTKSTGDGDNYGNGASVNNLTAVGTITLYAKWTATSQSITYILGGGTANNPATYTIEESVTLNNPIREGYNFTGWSGTGLEGEENMEVVIPVGSIGERVYTAHWAAISYDITYTGLDKLTEEELESISNPTSYTVENTFTLDAPMHAGYTFTGWTSSNSDTPQMVVVVEAGTTGTLNFEAHFTPNTYYVHFEKNPGPSHTVGGVMEEQFFTYDESQALTPSDFRILVEQGFKFGGWNTEPDGSGIHYDDGEVVKNLTTEPNKMVLLYAEWGRTPYTVIFDKNNDAAEGTMENVVKAYGERFNLPANGFTYAGHKLASWNTKPDGTGTSYADEASVINLDIDGEVTLYAQWRDVEAIFNTGNNVNTKIKNLAEGAANITSIVHYVGTPDTSSFTSENIISANNSPDLIYAWFDNGTIFYWSDDETPALNKSSDSLFAYLPSVTSIDLKDLDTSKAENISSMFRGCSSLQSLDLSEFDASNVTYMQQTFAETGLLSIDLSSFNTPRLTSLDSTFFRSRSLENITFGVNFNTENVTSFRMLFMEAPIKNIDISMFKTSNVTDMYRMFRGCGSLEEINFGDNFDTSNVENMAEMFLSNSKLKNLDLSTWHTGKVTNMSMMFSECNSLESLTFGPYWDTRNVTSMSTMFNRCNSLTELDLSMFDTRNVVSMANMFLYASSLEKIKFSENFTTEKVTSMNGMFEYCRKLKELDLSSFDTRNVTNMWGMFIGENNMSVIYATDKFVTDSVVFTSTSGDRRVFEANRNLVGGMGTSFDSIHNSIEYAHIDGGPDNPGYFTDKSKLNIFFDANGGSGTMASQVNLPANTDVTLNPNQFTINEIGRVFGGWNTEPDGTGTHYDDGGTINAYGRVVLYAQWGATPYTVHFDKNAGDAVGTMADIVKEYGKHFDLPANTFTREGYVFKGWNMKADGTGRHYNDQENVINLDNDRDATLYAEWAENQATFAMGENVNKAMRRLSGSGTTGDDNIITAFTRAQSAPDFNSITYETVSADGSVVPIYMWFNNGTIYWYSDARKIYLNENSQGFFSNLRSLATVDVSTFDTSNVSNLSMFFYGTNSLTSVDIRNWDTGNVTSMKNMFALGDGNSSLATLLFPTNFNTSNVRDMSGFLMRQDKITSLDVSGWNTSNVNDMNSMFKGCTGLTSITFGGSFDVSKVKDMGSMFSGDSGLTTLDLSTWNTSSLTNISSTFISMSSIETIYVSDTFDLSHITKSGYEIWGSGHVVGGAGTIYIRQNNHLANLVIDDPDNGKPGYFTPKNSRYIRYDANGGEGAMTSHYVKVSTSSTDTLHSNAFTREGFEFVGWNTTADGSGDSYSDEQLMNGKESSKTPLTLYAQWDVAQPNNTVMYLPNGGTGTMGFQEIYNYDGIVLTSPNYTKENSGFAGWNTAADGSGTMYGPTDTVDYPENGKIKLYAQWKTSAGNMQGFSCSSLSLGQMTALTDTRDGQTYTVAKLDDGKCWMTENLRFDIETNGNKINSTNTNNPDISFVSAVSQNPAPATTWCIEESSDCVDKITYNNENLKSLNTANSNRSYDNGVYYNWYTATAGNGTYSTAGRNVSGDICPAGWRLPTGYQTGDFGVLLGTIFGVDYSNTWSINNSTNPTGTVVVKKIRSYPYNFAYSGIANNDGIASVGQSIDLWGAYGDTFVFTRGFWATRDETSPGTGMRYKANGATVRCIAQ